ncbi:MAG: hypothetical protein V1708_04210 [Candidatus Micrarchaeota archaeon]
MHRFQVAVFVVFLLALIVFSTSRLPSGPALSISHRELRTAAGIPKAQLSDSGYDVLLDIPGHIANAELFRHPQKFFSGRRIRIVKKGVWPGFSAFPPGLQPPETIILAKREGISGRILSEKNVKMEKFRKDYFAVDIPPETETGFYTLDFTVDKMTASVPIEIYGLTAKEREDIKTPHQPAMAPPGVSLIKNLDCNNCYWELTSGTNPQNENYGYFVGGGAADFLVQTTDGWASKQVFSIDALTQLPKKYFRGDPELAFTRDGRLVIASLLYYGSEPISGGIYTEAAPTGFPVNLVQTIVQPVPPNLPPDTWLIFDYEKIAVDTFANSPYQDSTYIFANSVYFEDEGVYGTGFYTIRGTTITRAKAEDIGFIQPPQSAIVAPGGIIYAGRNDGLEQNLYYSLDGGHSFQISTIHRIENHQGCTARVSTTSDRAWGLDTGVDLAVGENGRLYAAWADFQTCIEDSTFEYGWYAYDNDVFISYSDNHGITWSNPVKVNNDDSGGDQGFPSIKVRDGVVYVAFLDHRENQDAAQYDVYLAKSFNDGVTFEGNLRVNDMPVENYYGGRNPGDYLDMVSLGGQKTFIAYPCEKSDNPNGGNPDDACVSVLASNFAISNEHSAEVTSSSAAIHWETNWPSNSYVIYSLNDQIPMEAHDLSHTTSHSILITGLQPNSVYSYGVSSCVDGVCWPGTGIHVFQTSPQPSPTPSPSPGSCASMGGQCFSSSCWSFHHRYSLPGGSCPAGYSCCDGLIPISHPGVGGSPLMSEVYVKDSSSGMVLLSENAAGNAAERESFKSYSAIALVAAGVLATAWFFYGKRRNRHKARRRTGMRR